MIRIGVIGVGHMGWLHARTAQGHPDAQLTAILDPETERTTRAASEFETEVVSSLDALAERCDAVVVAVPTLLHHAVVFDCLDRGLHVLVEKPIAATVSEGEDLTARAREVDRVLAVGHVERFNPVFMALEGEIDRPVFVEAHRLAPFVPRSIDVDVILDLMIHDIDLLLACHSPDVERVDASGVPVVTGREDIANARIAFTDGAVANLTASRVSRERMRRIRFFAGRTYLSLDLLRREGEVVRLVADPREWIARGEVPPASALLERREFTAPADANPLRDELSDFLAAIESNGRARVSGGDGTRALELALAIREQVLAGLRRIRGTR